MMPDEEIYDFIIVGGGPVGLHAGLKAALLNHTALVLDKGRKWCRIWFVPRVDNIPTHPDGISGRELVKLGREALEKYGHKVQLKDLFEVVQIEKDDVFKIKAMSERGKGLVEFKSRAVILATGIIDNQPIINGSIRPILPYANKGLVHYCLFCDGHMMTGQDVAVIGHGEFAANTAFDLTFFEAKSVTILTNGKEMFEDKNQDVLSSKLSESGVEIVKEEITGLFGLDKNLFGIEFQDGFKKEFDSGMVALGLFRINNDLAVSLGGQLDEDGYVVTDEDCRVLDGSGSPVKGLYAVGDVRNDWNQITIGFGDAERAVIHAYSYYL
ncbi:MAG: NAD(P)/FAD-dependent oxidoreductase [Methanobacteriota archaeon]|nr:MAG: NAD(P)/FAD-dependent oxidoreductase [Euryarchaeota archaeon]